MTISLNQEAEYRATMAKGLMSGNALKITTMKNATVEGNPGALLSFDVQLPDGTMALAQFSVTVKQLVALGRTMKAAYPGIDA